MIPEELCNRTYKPLHLSTGCNLDELFTPISFSGRESVQLGHCFSVPDTLLNTAALGTKAGW